MRVDLDTNQKLLLEHVNQMDEKITYDLYDILHVLAYQYGVDEVTWAAQEVAEAIEEQQ